MFIHRSIPALSLRGVLGRRLLALGLLGFLLGVPDPVHAKGGWEIVKIKEGIEVSVKEVEGRGLPIFRGRGIVKANLLDVIAVIQPHRYSRLQNLFDEFCTCCNDADTVIVADIYPAGETPIEGVDRDALVTGLRDHGHRNVIALEGADALASTSTEGVGSSGSDASSTVTGEATAPGSVSM